MDKINEAPRRPGSNDITSVNVVKNNDTRKSYPVNLREWVASEEIRLLEMEPELALVWCVTITSEEWSTLDESAIIELWKVFRSYILNGYKEAGQPIPAGVADVWRLSKSIIDREVAK